MKVMLVLLLLFKQDFVDNNATSPTPHCTVPFVYSGSLCRDELLSMSTCFPNDSVTPEIQVVRDASEQVQQLISRLEYLGSTECIAAAKPFICVYYFGGVCDGQGVHYFPTAQECKELSDGPCQTEFKLAENIGLQIVDCDMLLGGTPLLCSDSNHEFDEGEVFWRLGVSH